MNAWQRLKHDLGWQGMVGILLLACAYVFYIEVLTPLEQRARGLREKAEMVNQRGSLNVRMQEVALKSPEAMLGKFYAFFEPGKVVTDELAKIYSLAQANGLELKQGDYKMLREKDTRLTQYQVALPVRGGYTQIRAFAAQVLSGVPTASLDQIRFQRKRAGEPNVEAEIKLTLYLVH